MSTVLLADAVSLIDTFGLSLLGTNPCQRSLKAPGRKASNQAIYIVAIALDVAIDRGGTLQPLRAIAAAVAAQSAIFLGKKVNESVKAGIVEINGKLTERINTTKTDDEVV